MKSKSISLADRVFEQLENDILSGKYPRGTFLTELKLSTELEVSRTPIREALNRLKQERLIEESGKGIVILGVNQQDLIDIYDIRIGIEGLAIRKATPLLTKEFIEQFNEILELQEFYTKRNDYDSVKQQDGKFHDLLYSISGSSVLNDILSGLHRKIQSYRKMSFSSMDRANKAMQEHKDILNAMIAGDADKAEELAIKHIENAKANLVQNFKN